MDKSNETTAPKPAGIPKKDAPEAFREMAEKGTPQAKETYDKINAATTEAADLIKKQLRRLRVCRTIATRSSNSLTRTPTPGLIGLFVRTMRQSLKIAVHVIGSTPNVSADLQVPTTAQDPSRAD